MPNAQNLETLVKVKEDLQAAGAVWVVDYRGLTVKEVESLRKVIRESDAKLCVYKNTLVRIALEELEMTSMGDILEGPSAFIFAGADVAASAKAIKEFTKTNKKLEIKGGLMEGQCLSVAQVEAVAALPSREQLIGQIAGAINGVARGLAVSLSGVSRGLACATKAVAEQKPAA